MIVDKDRGLWTGTAQSAQLSLYLCPEMRAIAKIINVTTVQKKTTLKVTIIAKIIKMTNQGNDTGKYNKSLREGRERGFTNVTKIPKITIIARVTKITN